MFRLIDSGEVTPWRSAALEEALVISRERGGDDILHLYTRDRPTVSIGYFQSVEGTVDLEMARAREVALVRRMSGGSSIYTDRGQLIYSLILSRRALPDGRGEGFALICGALVKALASLGVEAEHKPVNDVLVNGRKISGSAQRRRGDVVIQHGTLMVDTDLEVMREVLRPREGKVPSYSGLIDLSRVLGPVPMTRVKEAVVDAFARTFDGARASSLGDEEASCAEALERERYGREEFILRR